jgi:uncharacterized protein YaiL (DUF2058 family)
MSSSLRDQLLKAGLVTEKQVKQADHQHRQPKLPKKQRAETAASAPKGMAQEAQAAKRARDQELNRQRREQEEKKARLAQIKQLIEQHGLPRVDSDDYFNFVDQNKVRRVSVNAELRARLNKGDVVIVRCEGQYSLIPADIVPRIRERDEQAIIQLNIGVAEPAAEDDPYKDFAVPDDLKW